MTNRIGVIAFLKRLGAIHFNRTTMVFACQRDSYQTEYTTNVVSCNECSSSSGKDIKEYEVILEDTILFPEGGGQVSKCELNSRSH